MKIATWNVNSIRVRKDRLCKWLVAKQPDALCLQETKVTDDGFPFDELRAVGYEAVTWGQKSYNGVAILSKTQPSEVTRGFAATLASDEQARCIAATISGVRIVSVYVPNGGEVGSDKYQYKLNWLAQLRDYLVTQSQSHRDVVLCGDMNVAPEPNDVYDPDAWGDAILCSPAERSAYALATAGLTDVVRKMLPQPGLFTWWDYRGLSFFKNQGLRIDHILCTSEIASRVSAASVDRNERKGSKTDQPSDHAPVMVEIAA